MPAIHRNNESTMKFLRELGWPCDQIDRSVPLAGGPKRRTSDFMGLADVAAFDGLPGVLFIQSTSKGSALAHWNRYREGKSESPRLYLDRLKAMLAAGNRYVIWGWYKRDKAVPGTKGKEREDVRVRGKLWTFREIALGLDRDGEPVIATDVADAYWAVRDAVEKGTRYPALLLDQQP